MTNYNYRLNATGKAQLRGFLANNYKHYDADDNNQFLAFCAEVEDSRNLNNQPIGVLEIRSNDSLSGHTENDTFSDDCFDAEEIDEDE